jgi:hypothetical protein
MHTYNFACTLPKDLPSSFEGEHGFVRYTVKVTLDRPWKFDQDTKMAFTVISHMDLNAIPQCRVFILFNEYFLKRNCKWNPIFKEPIQMHMKKYICCCWCKSGPLTAEIDIPVSGYCCGQSIPIDISVENGSDADVDEIKIKFIKVCRFSY